MFGEAKGVLSAFVYSGSALSCRGSLQALLFNNLNQRGPLNLRENPTCRMQSILFLKSVVELTPGPPETVVRARVARATREREHKG